MWLLTPFGFSLYLLWTMPSIECFSKAPPFIKNLSHSKLGPLSQPTSRTTLQDQWQWTCPYVSILQPHQPTWTPSWTPLSSPATNPSSCQPPASSSTWPCALTLWCFSTTEWVLEGSGSTGRVRWSRSKEASLGILSIRLLLIWRGRLGMSSGYSIKISMARCIPSLILRWYTLKFSQQTWSSCSKKASSPKTSPITNTCQQTTPSPSCSNSRET